jgi:deoxyhypusine synthase
MSDPSASTSAARESVLKPSEEISPNAIHIRGPDFSKPINLQDLLTGYESIGFQASGLARAIQIVDEMVRLLHTASVTRKMGHIADLQAAAAEVE